MKIDDLIRSRRTIGAFRNEQPDPAIVTAAIDVARWAPNHKKTEPWRVYLLGTQTAQRIVDLNSQMIESKKGPAEAANKRKSWSAVPGWIAINCLRSNDSFRQEEDYAACCCFIQNLTLHLWSNGIGTKWSTGDVTRESEYFKILGADPEQERSVGLIWYGYPAVTPEQTRKPLADFLVNCP